MPKLLTIREENNEEKKLREWFENQSLESPKNLDEAARLLIGLITGLLGVLFGVLTISAETLPDYLSLPLVKVFGAIAVVLWLASLLSGLFVVTPRKWLSSSGKPDSQQSVFRQIMDHKSFWLKICSFLFGSAIVSLGIVLIIALLSVS